MTPINRSCGFPRLQLSAEASKAAERDDIRFASQQAGYPTGMLLDGPKSIIEIERAELNKKAQANLHGGETP